MPKYFMCLGLLILLVAPSYLNASKTVKKKNCVVIHSYAYDYEWTVDQEKGIRAALKDNFGSQNLWDLKIHLLKSKNKPSDQILAEKKLILHALDQTKIDAAILTDDAAAKNFLNYFIDRKIPAAVAGINGNLTDYGYQPNNKYVTGSLERYNIIPSLGILKKLRPSLNHIQFIVGDYKGALDIVKEYKRQIRALKSLNSIGYVNYDQFVTNSVSQIKSKIKKLDPKTTALIVIGYYNFKEDDGGPIDYQSFDEWLRVNSKVLDVGSANFHIKRGRFMSLASSGYEMGYYSSNVLFQSLKSKTHPGESYPIRKTLPLKLVFNHERAKQLGVDIPFDILAYTRNLDSFESEN